MINDLNARKIRAASLLQKNGGEGGNISFHSYLHDVLEQNLGGQGPAVVHDRLPVLAVPTIH